MRKMCLGLVALVAFVVLTATSATATPIHWTLHDVAFDDGGTASGVFLTDSVTGNLLSYDITTTPGSVEPGQHYDGIGDFKFADNFWSPNSFIVAIDGITHYLNLSFVNPLTSTGDNPLVTGLTFVDNPPDIFDGSWECDNCGNVRTVTDGFATTVPEPATLFLLGSGVVALGKRRRRAS